MKVKLFQIMKATINNLVKNGAINCEGKEVETDKGTPQGGVISPLLANIAFAGMETMRMGLEQQEQNRAVKEIVQFKQYADDFYC